MPQSKYGGIPVGESKYGGIAVEDEPVATPPATPRSPSFDTALNPAEETRFREWKQKYAPRDSGEDYDLRGAFKAGLTPDPKTGHWPDTFKKPNHPTFSVESQYAQFAPDKAGRWQGPNHDQFVPAGANPARARRQAQGGGPRTAPSVEQERRERPDTPHGILDPTGHIYEGGMQFSRGVGELSKPGSRAQGASDVIRGGMRAAMPFVLPTALVANPGATLYGIGVGTGVGYGAESAARALGAEPGTAALTGDVAGLVSGGGMAAFERPRMVVGGAARGAYKAAAGSGKKLPLVEALKGAWEGAKAGSEHTELRSDIAAKDAAIQARDAPAKPPANLEDRLKSLSGAGGGRSGPSARFTSGQYDAPKPRRAPVQTGGAHVPDYVGPKMAPAADLRSDIAAPQSAPTAAPANAELDTIAKSLGGKDFASLPGPQQEAVRKIAAQSAKPKPAPTPAAPVPAPTTQNSPSIEVAKLEVGDAKPKTVREMLDAELEAKRNAKAAAKEVPVPAPAAAPAPGDYYKVHAQVKKAITVANDLKGKGITAKQLEELPLAQRKEALGKDHSDETFSRILFELRGLETGKVKPTAPVSSTQSAGSGAPPPVVKPVTATVRTPNQTRAKVQYKISEADDLKTSFDPDYNTEIGHQPRDTTRIGSRQRIEQRKADMDPEAMGQSRMAGDGAPITKEGNAVTRNHGTQALKELYAEGKPKAQEYRDWVADNAGLAGLSPDDVAGMKAPILHRELMEDWDHPTTKKFADDANEPSVASMSDSELARQMSGRMTGKIMNKFDPSDDGIPNADFVREITDGLPVEAQNKFQTSDGKISQTGIRLIRNAIFDKAYQSTEALEAMAEDPEPQVRNITTGMLKAAARNAQLQEAIAQGEAYPLGIGKEAGRAVEIINHLREKKLSVSDWLNQADLLGRDPAVHSLVDILAGESRRPNLIRDTLNTYADLVRQLGTPKQEGFFGPPNLPSKLELLENAYEQSKSAAAEAAARRKGKSEGEDLLGPGAGGTPASAGPVAQNH